MGDIAGHDRTKPIDILDERLTFERAGVKPYGRVLEVMRAAGGESVARTLPEQARPKRTPLDLIPGR